MHRRARVSAALASLASPWLPASEGCGVCAAPPACTSHTFITDQAGPTFASSSSPVLSETDTSARPLAPPAAGDALVSCTQCAVQQHKGASSSSSSRSMGDRAKKCARLWRAATRRHAALFRVRRRVCHACAAAYLRHPRGGPGMPAAARAPLPPGVVSARTCSRHHARARCVQPPGARDCCARQGAPAGAAGAPAGMCQCSGQLRQLWPPHGTSHKPQSVGGQPALLPLLPPGGFLSCDRAQLTSRPGTPS